MEPVVTVIEGNIVYWEDSNVAFCKIANEYEHGYPANLYEVLVEIQSGKSVCTDMKYDLPVLLKANAALVAGRIF